ncbi:MAG: ribonuclease III [Oscillospiraceae bacterium]|nr:ribonuclease III [Oscillospiraceae bacterium]
MSNQTFGGIRSLSGLEEQLGYTFRDRTLLETAVTHSSYANEKHGEILCYERLEFLGDSILGFVTAEFLYRHEPPIPEGRMTRLRSELVCEQSLYTVALSLNLSSYMRLGRGEENSGGRQRKSVLADMVEAIIAALYLDAGMERAKAFIMEHLLSHAEIGEAHHTLDAKTELQELVQQDGEVSIRYEEVSESGPDHNKTFTFRVVINGIPAGEGSGRSKKEAEQAAAAKALEELKA